MARSAGPISNWTIMTTPDDAGAAADQAHSPAMVRADLLTAIVFIVLAAAMLYGSWTMDRLEVRRIHPFTAPGVVPGLLSAALLLNCNSSQYPIRALSLRRMPSSFTQHHQRHPP